MEGGKVNKKARRPWAAWQKSKKIHKNCRASAGQVHLWDSTAQQCSAGSLRSETCSNHRNPGATSTRRSSNWSWWKTKYTKEKAVQVRGAQRDLTHPCPPLWTLAGKLPRATWSKSSDEIWTLLAYCVLTDHLAPQQCWHHLLTPRLYHAKCEIWLRLLGVNMLESPNSALLLNT